MPVSTGPVMIDFEAKRRSIQSALMGELTGVRDAFNRISKQIETRQPVMLVLIRRTF